MKHIYVQYTRYNVWANRRLAGLFSQAPAELCERHLVSSFPSVKLTVQHVWSAEWVWLQRLLGNSPTSLAMANFQGSMAEALEGWLRMSEEFSAFVEKQDDDFFEKKLTYKNIAGVENTSPACQMIHHCMNHSTFHRGQLVMMARQLGLEKVPATDMILFLREQD